MDMWQAIVVGLVVAATTGIFKLLFPWTKKNWAQWRRRRAVASAARKQRRQRAQYDRALAQKIATAEATGEPIAVSRRGHRPVEVTYSDGSVRYFFCNPEDYRAAITTGGYDPRTSYLRSCSHFAQPGGRGTSARHPIARESAL
ncbi:hypothetical protein [Nocardia paucivorans]|uniref:hypothetical protein n=1 Tax=Nocardia paucivorans TaxID=114259 RepID=UPI00030E4B33|nr:hypothetical protein [Nocardia paucivorans]